MPTRPQQFNRQPKRVHVRRPERQRLSPSKRGYNTTWTKLRLMVLRAEPMCRTCGAVATDVDHITPLARGGLNEFENLQPLCKVCHGRKTRTEG